jgi:hypothetical protein
MQISASTIQAQQAARVAPKAPQPADAFEPLNFKQTAKVPPPAPETQATAPAIAAAAPGLRPSAGTGYVRPGTNIDIKV